MKNKTVIDQLFKSKAFIVQNEIKVSRDNGKDDPPFFCVYVPKKCFSRAVDRNKIRRRIKSALSNMNIDLSGSFLITYKNINMMSYQKIEKTLANMFKISN